MTIGLTIRVRIISRRSAALAAALRARRLHTRASEAVNSRTTLPSRTASGKWLIATRQAAIVTWMISAVRAIATRATISTFRIDAASSLAIAVRIAAESAAADRDQVAIVPNAERRVIPWVEVEVAAVAAGAVPLRVLPRHITSKQASVWQLTGQRMCLAEGHDAEVEQRGGATGASAAVPGCCPRRPCRYRAPY